MKYTTIQIDAIASYLVNEFPEQVLAVIERGNPSTTVVVRHRRGKRHDVVLKQNLPPSAEECTEALQYLQVAEVMRTYKDQRLRFLVTEDGVTTEPLAPLKLT